MAYVRHLREPTKRSLLLIDTAGRDVLVEGGNSSRERRSVVLTNQLHYATGSRDTSVPSQRHGQLRAHQKHKRTRRIRPAQTILQRAYIMKVERHVGILDYRHQLESAHRIGAGTGEAERGVFIAEAARNPGHQMQAEHIVLGNRRWGRIPVHGPSGVQGDRASVQAVQQRCSSLEAHSVSLMSR